MYSKYTVYRWALGILKLNGCCLSPNGASLQLFNFRIPNAHLPPYIYSSILHTLVAIPHNMQKNLVF